MLQMPGVTRNTAIELLLALVLASACAAPSPASAPTGGTAAGDTAAGDTVAEDAATESSAPTVTIAEPEDADVAPEPVEAKAARSKPAKPMKMTTDRLAEILDDLGDLSAERGAMKLRVEGVALTCLTDDTHDRMRFVVAIIETAKMTAADKDRVLDANFHTALDARYATYDGVLFSAFIHPLSTLDEASVKAGVSQVVTLAKTYGTTYNSGELMFAR
jgi:hypothetical protein